MIAIRKKPKVLRELIDFCYVMLPHCQDPQETLEWHLRNLGIVTDRDHNYHGVLQGITLFRKLNRPEEAEERWFHVPDGPLLWVDWTVSLLRGGLARMIQTTFQTLGRPEAVGFSRHKQNDRKAVYPVSFFDRLVRAGV
ncbi:MAG: hypothetical protein EBS53_00875 [Bacteroidetes bacterium]|nr:hypothetical protein [Bacteroidota bacterium]